MSLSSAVHNYVSDLDDLFSPTREARRFYQEQVEAAAKSLEGDHVIGFVGMGYPFYAFKGDDNLIPVQEISRFLNEIRTNAALCESCDVDLSNTTIGYSDREVQGMPRVTETDLVSALPDLDMAIVVEQIDQTTVSNLRRKLIEAGLCGSDPTLGALFGRTRLLRDQLHGAHENKSTLPIDCSIWLKDDLLQALNCIRKGRLLTKLPYKNFKDQWRDPADGYCLLAADLMFSATPIAGHTDPLIHSEILETQHYLSRLFRGARFDLLTSVLKLRKDRVGRTLRDPQVLDNLKERMSNFQDPGRTYNG